MNFDPYFILYKELAQTRSKHKSIRFLYEILGKNIRDLGLSKDFLEMTPKQDP